MSEGSPTPGGDPTARHKAPSKFQRVRGATTDAASSVAHSGGRIAIVTATGGALAVAAVVGAQAAGAPSTTASDQPVKAAKAVDDARGQQDRGGETVSRSAQRPSLATLKKKSLAGSQSVGGSKLVTETAKKKKVEKSPSSSSSGSDTGSDSNSIDTSSLSSGDPRSIAKKLLGAYGWGQDQFGCLDDLWVGESNWRVNAANPSGAYGIPQALPGSKMASAGSDWQTNAATQIKWGLGYIKDRYGSPCGAQSFKSGHGFY